MKLKLLVAASLLAFSVNSIAAMPPKPKKCPTAASIQAEGLSNELVVQDSDGTWVVGLMQSDYGTKYSWTFVVGKIEADDENDAFDKATASLSSLAFARGPIAISQISKWGCAYTNDENYPAVAVSPSLEGSISNLGLAARSLS